MESVENPGRSLQEKEGTSVEQTVTAVRQMEAAYDVKIPITERFNAVFFLEKPHITDFAGREMGKNYNAMIGFQIILR